MERVRRRGGRAYAVIEASESTTELDQSPPKLSAYPPAALNPIDTVVCTIDRNFRITTVNDAWQRLALDVGGTAPCGAGGIGHHLLDCALVPQRESLRAICAAAFRGEWSRYEFEATLDTRAGSRVYHVSITPLRSPEGTITGATLTGHDVTQYKALLAAVVSQQQQVQQTLASLRRREARARMLQRTAEALNSTKSLAATLRVVAEAAVCEAEVQAAVVYILADNERLVPAGSYGIDTGSRISKSFWLESSLARRVVEEGRLLLVDDTTRAADYSFPRLQNGEVRAVAALPITGPSGIKGVLEVYAAQAGAFDADHVALLHALADQAALAIRTAQLVERERRQTRLLRLINQVGEQLASELNEQDLMRFVTKALVEKLGMTFARVWLYDEPSNTLVLRSSSGLYTGTGGQFARIKLGQYAVGQIAASRQAFITNDVAHEPGVGDREWAETTGMRSFAGYPLVARNRLLGVLAFFSREPLDPELVKLLDPLVHQVALALERAMLYVAQVAARREAQQLARLAGTRAAQLSATLAAMTDGVWTCDTAGRVLTVNEAALAMLGCSPDQPSISHIDDIASLLADEAGNPGTRLGLRSALEGGTVRRELELRPCDATQPTIVALVATPMRDAGGQITGAVSVVRDVTQQKAMEQLREDFLAMAAHELKTPVTAIKGYAQLALTRLQSNAEPQRLQRALETINTQAERIAHLVQELLDASRIQEGFLVLQPECFDLVALAQRCIEHVHQQTTKHEFRLEAPPALEGAWDQLRIEQVLQNLLENAVKYSPGGSIVTTIALRDHHAQVTVRDYGVGISPEKQQRVFEPWFQAHADTVGDYGGMGLGLSICKEIVERHGGHMWVESNEGEGSLFGFTLPIEAVAERTR